MKLFPFFAAAALTLGAAPAHADTYSHSFPGIGPTGTYCTTIINGNSGSTSCSRGLTAAEVKADEAQWAKQTAKGLKAQGKPANFCQSQAAKAQAIRVAARGAADSSNVWADVLVCQSKVQSGQAWEPFFLYPEDKAAWDASR